MPAGLAFAFESTPRGGRVEAVCLLEQREVGVAETMRQTYALGGRPASDDGIRVLAKRVGN